MTAASTFQLRSDLIHQPIRVGDETVWVVKDPISSQYVYVDAHERALLLLADGKRTLHDIVIDAARRFAPQYVSPEAILSFFAQAKGNGLLTNTSAFTSTTTSRDEKRWWHNPLAIRLPGIQPTPLLNSLNPLIQLLTSRIAVVAAILLTFIAAGLALTHLSALTVQLRSLTETGLGRALGWTIVIVSLTKFIHELAHAVACKRLGGECREIGVMLLFGIPCLYCDVTDSWMMPKRLHRMTVAAAGMMAEWVIASLAMFVWMFASDAATRDVAVIVIATCTITTVLINGNPLLRYDGYYIACDLFGIPNLAPRSQEVLRGMTQKYLLGVPTLTPLRANNNRRTNFWLATYSLASFAYRITLYAALSLALYRFAEKQNLHQLTGLMLITLFSIAALRGIRRLIAPTSLTRDRRIAPSRVRWVSWGAIMGAMLLMLIPLPRTVQVPIVVEARNSQPLFVPVPGILCDSVDEGTDLNEGDTIVALDNVSVRLKKLEYESLCERYESELAAFRARRSVDSGFADRIPILEQQWTETQKQRDLFAREADALIIRSPKSGRFYSRRSNETAFSDVRQIRYWSGTTIDRANRGAWVGAGTLLGFVGDPAKRDAIAMVSQTDIGAIRANQEASLEIKGWGNGNIRGRVVEVSAAPVDSAPAPSQKTPAPSQKTPAALHNDKGYQVRIEIETSTLKLPVQLSGHASIRVAPESLAYRLWRGICSTF